MPKLMTKLSATQAFRPAGRTVAARARAMRKSDVAVKTRSRNQTPLLL